ncbi:hypothetical protein ACI48D_23790 [Massilia sp. LXY-6]|uniref:hypothetical protein n=1 Tax=Massilia sp. LXY-6 TaxID=3379823 RepID=UPI003EE300C4
MKTSLPSLFCFVMTAALAPNSPAAARCTLKPLAPHESKLIAGTATINLGDADEPSAPTAWQGPLKAGTCSFDIGIIEQPMALTPAQLLYVTTYSGSMRTVTLFDLNTCSVRWKSEPFAGKVALMDSALTLGQKRMALNDQCLPGSDRKRK